MKKSTAICTFSHVRILRQKLLRWALENPASFPWRRRTSKFHSLIVEILLQRTKAEQVIPVFNQFRKDFPSASMLAQSRIISIRRVIRPLGLIWRAEYLKSLGIRIVHDGGGIPDDYDILLSLPGVGPYAAGAYLSLHRNIRHVIIDSNVVRLYCRLIGKEYDGETRRKSWVQHFAEEVTPQDCFKEYNYALLDFSRAVCKPNPVCGQCPLEINLQTFYKSQIISAPWRILDSLFFLFWVGLISEQLINRVSRLAKPENSTPWSPTGRPGTKPELCNDVGVHAI